MNFDESLDGPFTVGEALRSLVLPSVQRSWVLSLTVNEATLEIPVATITQKFAMFLSRRYGIVLDDVLSSYLILLRRCLGNEHASYAIWLQIACL